MADLVGGALLGVVVGKLLQDVIKVAKMAILCKKNCKVLLATLESISPSFDQVAKSANNSDVACQKWLGSVEVLLGEAKSIVEKCSQTKRLSDYVSRSKLSRKVMDINRELREKLPELNLIALDTVQTIKIHMLVKASSINVSVGSGGKANMHDTPKKIVPFVENHFGRLKSVIMDDAREVGAPIIFGLKGRGGAGKTLLAKMVNNDEDIQRKFTSNSILWITIGRDATIPSIYSTMAKLMKDGDVYERDFKCKKFEDQRGYMLATFKEKKVLLILDDVWDCYPVKDRAMMEWLDVAKGVGSITLVTTREAAVLHCGKAKEIVEVESLSEEDSWDLFCIHAFGSLEPASVVIKGLAKEVCEECDGLPLAIEVIGSAMYEKDDEGEWEWTLKCLKGSTSMPHSRSVEKELEHKLYNQLNYSYEELDEVSKKCFLYFAAFPEDYEIETKQLCSIWHVEQFFGCVNEEVSKSMGEDVLIDLVDRSLVDFSKSKGKEVVMHDVLRDLAIRILGHAKPLEWAHECFFRPGRTLEAFPIIEKKVKRMSLMGCKIEEFPSNLELPCIEVCLLSSIKSASNNEIVEIPRGFFSSMKALLMLDLSRCGSLKEVPKSMGELKALTHLNLSGCRSLKEVPKSMGELKALTHLNLSGCRSLKEVPESMGELKALTHLNLSRCGSLKEVPKSMGELTALMHLNLSGCRSLKEVPKSMGELKALTHLDLSWCGSLKEVPKSMGELKALTHLNLSGCRSLKEVPESMGELKALTHLDLSNCGFLEKVPESMGELKALTHLDLSWCGSLEKVPESMGELKALTHLNLSGCGSLKEVPESMGELKALTHLDLSWCGSLEKVPESMGELKALTHLNLSGCGSLKEVPESMGELKALTHLDLSNCGFLEKVPESMGELKALTHLNLSWCGSLKEVPKSMGELKALMHLDLSGCRSLKEVPKSMGELKALMHLDLSGCRSLKEVPQSMGELKALTHLDLSNCDSLEKVPESMGKLKALMHLDLSWCGSLKEVLESMGELKALTHLNLSGCRSLKEVPKSMGELKALTHLNLSGCRSLKEVPESMGELKALTHLDLSWCGSLEKVPESMGELKALTHLDLSNCGFLEKVPESMGELKALTHLDLSWCGSLEKVPESMGELKTLTHLDFSLKDVPEGMGELKALTHSDLLNCDSLEKLPKSMGELKALTHLDLSDCDSLEKVSESMGELKALTHLDLSDCDSLEKVPESMGELKALTHLDLSLKDVPEGMGELKALTHLNLRKTPRLTMASRSVDDDAGCSSRGISYELRARDLPSKRLLGKGLASIAYETEWNGERFARKDFIGVPSGSFQKEASVLVGLEDHKNVVKTHGWTVDKLSCSLVLEYVEEDLLDLLQKRKESLKRSAAIPFGSQSEPSHTKPFGLAEALDIVVQIARGMEFLHAHHISHEDLKTKNILVTHTNDGDNKLWTMKVADFGLVRTKSKSMSFVSRQARKLDMVYWQAPEILEGLLSEDNEETSSESDSDPEKDCAGPPRVIDRRAADVYSFALICSQILTGEDPYPSGHWKELGSKIVSGALRPNFRTGFPQLLTKFLIACWRKVPAERPTFSSILALLGLLHDPHTMATCLKKAKFDRTPKEKWLQVLLEEFQVSLEELQVSLEELQVSLEELQVSLEREKEFQASRESY